MKYFVLEEFACKHCGALPANGMSAELLTKVDLLRQMYGRPIYVNSGYRCQYWNMVNGGVPNSQHRLGTAADLVVDGDYEEFYQLVVNSNLFSGVGYYPPGRGEFVHVDCRPGEPNEYQW